MDSLWTATTASPPFPALRGDLSCDVAVIGAGITGLTAAWRLARAGRDVIVLEAADAPALGESAHTSGHLTAVQDVRFARLIDVFGVRAARRVADAGLAAIEQVEECARELALDCDLRRVPGFLYAEARRDRPALDREHAAARRLGLDVRLVDEVPLPFPTAGALRFSQQAVFHPRRYLLGLARGLVDRGGRLFVRARVTAVHDGVPCRLRTLRGRVQAGEVLICTDAPLNDRGLVQLRLAARRSYVASGRIAAPLEGLFWDLDEPYHYLRTWQGPGGTELIAGGEDHPVGADRTAHAAEARLEAWTRQRFRLEGEVRRWSGQILEPADGLPYVGRRPLTRHVWVATGLSGNGLANGTLAGRLLAEQLLGRRSALGRLLSPSRLGPLSSARELVREGAGYPRHLVQDHLGRVDRRPLDELPPGEGRVIEVEGRKLAVFRDETGRTHALSPVCPHLGCHVHWNDAERSWDCPCHGSRFDAAGHVLHGPAVRDLSPVELPAPKPAAPPPPPLSQGTPPERPPST